uniref:Uncharacterized protein n=1 Tax=Junco hyemalis TaxID=40217 RepID=A0A8C5IWG9_JUNHY
MIWAQPRSPGMPWRPQFHGHQFHGHHDILWDNALQHLSHLSHTATVTLGPSSHPHLSLGMGLGSVLNTSRGHQRPLPTMGATAVTPRVAQRDPGVAQRDPGVAQRDPRVALRDPRVAQRDPRVALRDPLAVPGGTHCRGKGALPAIPTCSCCRALTKAFLRRFVCSALSAFFWLEVWHCSHRMRPPFSCFQCGVKSVRHCAHTNGSTRGTAGALFPATQPGSAPTRGAGFWGERLKIPTEIAKKLGRNIEMFDQNPANLTEPCESAKNPASRQNSMFRAESL